MKKILIILLLIAFRGISQDIPSGTLNVLLGPSYNGGYGGLITAEYEIQMLDDNLTIGPKLGFGTTRYNNTEIINDVVVVQENRSSLILNPGLVAHYYFDWLIDDMPNHFDLFAKADFGYWFVFDNDHRTRRNYLPMTFGLYAGGRYHFESDWSLYLSIGFGMSYANIGLSKKF